MNNITKEQAMEIEKRLIDKGIKKGVFAMKIGCTHGSQLSLYLSGGPVPEKRYKSLIKFIRNSR